MLALYLNRVVLVTLNNSLMHFCLIWEMYGVIKNDAFNLRLDFLNYTLYVNDVNLFDYIHSKL